MSPSVNWSPGVAGTRRSWLGYAHALLTRALSLSSAAPEGSWFSNQRIACLSLIGLGNPRKNDLGSQKWPWRCHLAFNSCQIQMAPVSPWGPPKIASVLKVGRTTTLGSGSNSVLGSKVVFLRIYRRISLVRKPFALMEIFLSCHGKKKIGVCQSEVWILKAKICFLCMIVP